MLKSLCKPNHGSLTIDETVAASRLLPIEGLRVLHNEYELYWYLKENPNIVVPEGVWSKIQPKKTVLNKIGEFASCGTDCVCCLGYRIYAAFFIGIGVGLCATFL